MLRQILTTGLHDFRCYLRVPSFGTSTIYHLLVYCIGSFLLQDLFLSLQVFAFKGQNITFTVNVLLTPILYSVTPGPAMIRAVYEYSRLILITVVILVLLRFPSETPKLNCNQTIAVSWDEHLENLVSVQHLYSKKKPLFVQKS